MNFMNRKHLSIISLFLIFVPFMFFLSYSCSSDTGGNNITDVEGDVGLRLCKNSAQCKPDEECINNVCQKRGPKDAEVDINADVIIDVADVTTEVLEDIEIEDVADVGEDVEIGDGGDAGIDVVSGYNSGISSVYEGVAGECEDGEYIVKSVSGYGGMGRMENEEFTVNNGARFKK